MTDNERKESISALRQLVAMCDFVDQYGDFIDADPYFNAVETAIESLNETRWIPVSERLPDDFEHVLVTLGNGYDGVTYDWRADGDWYDWGKSVLAWMPLPKPYREDGEA